MANPFGLTVPFNVAVVPLIAEAGKVLTIGLSPMLNEMILVFRASEAPIYCVVNQNV